MYRACLLFRCVNKLIDYRMKNVTMEQPDLNECGIEVKQELEEDPLAG